MTKNQDGAGGTGGVGVAVEIANRATAEDAAQLANVLRTLGYPVSVMQSQGLGRETSFRVQVGPYSSRDAAEKVAQKLAMEGFKPVVPNTAPVLTHNHAPETTQHAGALGEASEAGFVAQAAADGNRQAAIERLERLKARGFPVFLSEPGKGSHLFRVLVGPFPSYADADTARRRLEAEGLKPFVRSWKAGEGEQQ
jgi:cell division septation protein DedD